MRRCESPHLGVLWGIGGLVVFPVVLNEGAFGLLQSLGRTSTTRTT